MRNRQQFVLSFLHDAGSFRKFMPALMLSTFVLSGCTSINGMQDSVVDSDLHKSVCPSAADLSTFQNKTGADKGEFRDRTILDCIKAIDTNYKFFKSDLQREAVTSNLIPDVLALGLSGAAVLTKSKTAKQFSQGALAVAGIGAAVDKDVFYQQTLPAIESSMDAKRDLILKGIVDSEKGDPTATSYTLESAGIDLDAYESAGNIYAAISELITTANGSAQAAKAELTASQNAPYCATLVTSDIHARLVNVTSQIKTVTDQTKLGSMAKALNVPLDTSVDVQHQAGQIVAAVVNRVHVCGAQQPTAMAAIESALASNITVPTAK